MQSFFQRKRLNAEIHERINATRRRYQSDADALTDSKSNKEDPENQESTFSKSPDSYGSTFSDKLVRQASGIRIGERDQDGSPKIYLVKSGDQHLTNPQTWSLTKRHGATFLVFTMVFSCGWASGADSSARRKAAADFGISKEAESLSTAAFLFGNGIGALAAGPISETAGRNPSYLGSMTVFLLCVMTTALAPNLEVQVLFRFLSGLFASPPMTIYGGSLADLYDDTARSYVWPIFALAPILGPILAPIAGGWIIESGVTRHWVDWTTLIISGSSWILCLVLLPETYSDKLLHWKAKALRSETKDDRFKSTQEQKDSFWKQMRKHITLPLIFFTREPIVIFLGLYLTLIYVLVFTFLDGFTYIFIDTYGFSNGKEGSCFAAMAIGVLLNALTSPFFASRYVKNTKAKRSSSGNSSAKLPPEIRLYPAMIAAPLLPISLLWLGWTNYPSISPWSGIVAVAVFGFSLMGIFTSSYEYIIDSYEMESASALASITFMRYMVSGGMAIADMPMYNALGVHWTLTLLGCLGVALTPVPFVFHKFGPAIRKKSHFSKA